MKTISIEIGEDRLEARISINAVEENFPEEVDIYTAIGRAGVVYGIDHSVIREIASQKMPVEDQVFAWGKDATQIQKEKLIWYLDLSDHLKPRINAEGKADFKQLKQVELVKKGQNIVSQVPDAHDLVGRLVTGDEVRVKQNYLHSIQGKNLSLSDDGLTLVSTIDGCVFWKTGKLNVDNIYHIAGDVDFRTGNVKFDGTILIDGDVRSGFRVAATGAIYIGGNIEAAEVYSEYGDIVVKSGVLGKGRAKIIAGGNLHCRFLQDATIGVRKDVVIEHYAINSGISAGGRIFLIQNEGLIRGGKAFADAGMRAMEIGSPQNIATDIGISSVRSRSEDIEHWNLDMMASKLKKQMSRNLKRVEFLQLLEKRLKKLSPEKQEDMANSVSEIEKIEAQLAEIESKKKRIMEKSLRLDRMKSITVDKTLHKGVVITIGDVQYYNDSPKNGVKIFRSGNQILIEKCGEVT